MLSSALRENSTDHLDPDADQRIVEWKEGDTENNIAALAIREMEVSHERIPELNKLSYDFGSARIVDEAGKIVQPFQIRAILQRADPEFAKGVGVATASRAIATRAALRGEGIGSLARGNIQSSGVAFGEDKILYSRAPSQQSIPGTAMPEETSTEATQRLWQDSAVRFKSIEETMQIAAAKEAGYKGDNIHDAIDYMKANGIRNPISDNTDVYQEITLSGSRAAVQTQEFETHQVQPLVKETAKANITMADIDEFLKVQHALEANVQNRKIHGDEEAVAFGISDAEANKLMAEFKSRPDFAKLESIANKWQALTGETLDMREAAGVIAKGQADAYRCEARPLACRSVSSQMIRLRAGQNQARR